MVKSRVIDVDEVMRNFRINGDKIERLSSNGKQWIELKNKSNISSRYSRIKLNGCFFSLHRILWVLYNGSDIPKGLEIDHINGDRYDNRMENLRAVSHRENNQNMRRHRLGFVPGVNYLKSVNKYQARIKIGKLINLGLFNDIESAYNVYKIACDNVDKYVENKSFRELVKKIYKVKDEKN